MVDTREWNEEMVDTQEKVNFYYLNINATWKLTYIFDIFSNVTKEIQAKLNELESESNIFHLK